MSAERRSGAADTDIPSTDVSCTDILEMFVEGIAVLDNALACRERGLYGVTWLVDVHLTALATRSGMVVDFGEAKPLIKHALESRYDHKLMVAKSLVETDDSGGALVAEWTDAAGQAYRHKGPEVAYCLTADDAVTMHGLADEIQRDLIDVLPGHIASVHVDLREEEIDGAAYHYCHGLRLHDGDCQRIAHGHRSRIEVKINGQRGPAARVRLGRAVERCLPWLARCLDDEHARRGYVWVHGLSGRL